MININTTEYIKYKEAIINGVEFKFRNPTSAETIEILDLQEKFKDGKGGIRGVAQLFDWVLKMCDKPDKAREVFDELPIESIVDIYKQIMESE